jgi:hypothetical protein
MDVNERMKGFEQNHLFIGSHGKVIREREKWSCTQNLRSVEEEDSV